MGGAAIGPGWDSTGVVSNDRRCLLAGIYCLVRTGESGALPPSGRSPAPQYFSQAGGLAGAECGRAERRGGGLADELRLSVGRIDAQGSVDLSVYPGPGDERSGAGLA